MFEAVRSRNAPPRSRTLERLRQEHRDLDAAIEALGAVGRATSCRSSALKKRKLRDRLSFVEDQLTPFIIASRASRPCPPAPAFVYPRFCPPARRPCRNPSSEAPSQSPSSWGASPTGDHAPRRRDAHGARRRPRGADRLAHRTPDRLVKFAKRRQDEASDHHRGAGGAVHFAGHDRLHDAAAGIRRAGRSKALSGQDSLLSIVQMPAGVPVGTLAIGRAGAVNAAPGGGRPGAARRGAGRPGSTRLAVEADRFGCGTPER